MNLSSIRSLFIKHKESKLQHRYITNRHIEPLLENLKDYISIETIGKSVLNDSIYGLKIGNGKKRILMWSQMHGNESTTTKAIFDLLNSFLDENSDLDYILSACTLYIIPILNPDGAEAYTRINANKVDLNRDAQNLSQPESNILKRIAEDFKPHYCYNLHGQRTIFSAGTTNKLATVSFLAPSQDKECSITPNRKIAMEIIAKMNATLQEVIPGQVGVYDDAFNLNCVGDTFQSQNIPTILFEAGHYAGDYGREFTRELIYMSYISSLDYIAKNDITGRLYEPYLSIPENDKCFYDVIIRNVLVDKSKNIVLKDIGILYQEKLVDDKIEFSPKVIAIESLCGYYGHIEYDANGSEVFDAEDKSIEIGYENNFILIENKKTPLIIK